MNGKNPGIILLLQEEIDFHEVISQLKTQWKFECDYEVEKEDRFVNYSFSYENVNFCLSEFHTKFPEDVTKDIQKNVYGEEAELKKIYDRHNKFWIVAVIGKLEKDLNQVYALFTRVVMSMLRCCKEALVYNTRSRLIIKSDIYLEMYPHMKSAYEKQQDGFPIDWYVNIHIYQDNEGLSAVTEGFDVFNDYEIEIHNQSMEYEELYRIMKFIIVNVISRQDKISNRDLLPIPLGDGYEEAIVKQFHSEVLGKEALAIIL